MFMASPLHDIINSLNPLEFPNEYIEEIKNYAIALDAKNLPIIFTKEHLAILMNRSPQEVALMVSNSHAYYNVFKIRKKAGGDRWIMAPKDELKYVQNWIKANILDKVKIHEGATAFFAGSSIRENAAKHSNSRMILNIDLYRFFDSINERRVFGLFKSLGYHPNLCVDLARLLTVCPPKNYWKVIKKENKFRKKIRYRPQPILPQGSPASPTISNIICFNFDSRVYGLCKKSGCNYSRYVDDVTISGERDKIPSFSTLKRIIRKEGFYINNDKTKYLPDSYRQTVTGLSVNAGVHVISSFKKNVYSHLYYSIKYGPENHLSHLRGKKRQAVRSNFKQWLSGCISYVSSIEPHIGKDMYDKFNLIEWEL